MTDTARHGSGPSQRTIELVVVGAAILFGLLVIAGSLQVGIGWGAEGPKSGFFPFYIGLIIIAASVVNLLQRIAVRGTATFAEWSQLRQVFAVVAPTTVYVF